jgi:hypothetical protein
LGLAAGKTQAGLLAAVLARRLDRGCRDAQTKPDQFAPEALVAPAWVLPGQADDQVLELQVEWRSPGCAGRVGPGAGDQAAMPAQQRLRLDEAPRPARPRQDPAQRGEQGAVGGLEPGSRDLAAQCGQLVAKHQDLQVLGGIAVGAHHEQPMERHRVR